MSMQETDFYGPGGTINPQMYIQAAAALQCEPAVLMAIVQQESRGKLFLPDGRPVILYEPFTFHRLTSGAYDADPIISVANRGDSNYGASGDHQYVRLIAAMSKDEDAALKSTSWGFWQCMGFNYGMCGFSTVQDMVKAFVSSGDAQLQAFISYLSIGGFIPLLQSKDWAGIARKFNGPKYRENNYDTALQKYYKQFSGASPQADSSLGGASPHVVSRGDSGVQVVRIQQLLNVAGAKPQIRVDGQFGPHTDAAIRDFQAKHNLTVDGIAGPQVLTALATARVDTTTPLASKRVAAATIGGATAVGSVASGGAILQSMQQIADNPMAQHSLAAAQQATQQAIDAGHGAVILIVVLAVALAVESGYIVWTKLADFKKLGLKLDIPINFVGVK